MLSSSYSAVPIIFAWRDEFEKKESNAISRALGKPPPSRGGVLSRGGARSFDQMQDDRVRLLFDHNRILK